MNVEMKENLGADATGQLCRTNLQHYSHDFRASRLLAPMYRMLGGIPHGMLAYRPFDRSAAAAQGEAVADEVFSDVEEAVQTERKRKRRAVT